jgi:hypothetical protein
MTGKDLRYSLVLKGLRPSELANRIGVSRSSLMNTDLRMVAIRCIWMVISSVRLVKDGEVEC